MRTFLELPKQAGLPQWLAGRHPLFLTEDGRVVDEDGDILDRDTFVRMHKELGARILLTLAVRVAQALGFSGRSRHAESSKLRAGITQPLQPHLFRHQMLTYLTSKGLSDAQIQLISGHESKKSLEVYQHLSLESVDKAYQDAVQSVGI